jgi:hypothetical protein
MNRIAAPSREPRIFTFEHLTAEKTFDLSVRGIFAKKGQCGVVCHPDDHSRVGHDDGDVQAIEVLSQGDTGLRKEVPHALGTDPGGSFRGSICAGRLLVEFTVTPGAKASQDQTVSSKSDR